MKRYEKMSKEEIINFFSEENGCDFCSQGGGKFCDGRCSVNKGKYLREEIELVPRYKTFETDEDVMLSMEEFSAECRKTECSRCRLRSDSAGRIGCKTRYLLEKVEKK